MIYVGIDPGNKGAFVALDDLRQCVYQEAMPLLNIGKGKKNKWVLDKSGIVRILRSIIQLADAPSKVFVTLEKAQVMGGGGASAASPRSMFGYGRGFGCLEMALICEEIPHQITHPRTWGNQILNGIEGGDTKARAILKCQRGIPTLDLVPGRCRKPQDGLADAGCMALYSQLTGPREPNVRSTRKSPPPPPR